MSGHDPIPRTHPPEDVRVAHALGQLEASQRVLVEAHLDFCPHCAAAQAEVMTAGGLYLRQSTTETPPPEIWRRLAARLDDEPAADHGWNGIPLPAAARAELEPRVQPPRWRRLLLSAARFTPLPVATAADVHLLLVTIPAGRHFPRHIHLGREDLIVLAGGYRDDAGHFLAGDYGDYDPGTGHRPDVDDDEPCWIVTRIEGGVRFTGWRGLLQRIVAHRGGARTS